ncbi:MAG: crotonase/enoyl-CoA hydratase family protein [Proteobacteria bacterium]|nr:crotonase/enoyl-CoA hydratase family protein [Pseudomonadota bacterium]
MSTIPYYLVEKKGPVAWVYLNRPEKKNAMHPPAWKDAPAIFEELDEDPEVSVIIVAGKGSDFCVGIDLMEMMGELPELMEPEQKGGVKWQLLKKIYPLQETMTCMEKIRKPVIAAVHGYCIGAGLDMITACDIRLCTKDAVFCLKEAAVGFVADVGVLQRLPLIVGQGITRELAFTAKTITAERAEKILLVNQVFSDYDTLLAKAEEMALQIADNSSLAVQASKDVLNFGVGKSIEEGLKYVAAISSNIIPSHDLMEAVTAFMEKRKPEFTGR